MPFSLTQAAALDTLFEQWNHSASPGAALGIVQQGQLVYARGYGQANLEDEIPITPSSVFHVASLSKQVTAMLVVQLALEGKLSLDDDLHRYIPELPVYETPLTLQHCLWHISGLRDQWELLYLAGWRDGDLVTTPDIVRLLGRQHSLNFPSGTAFCYCNSGYTLLGIVIERVTGTSLRTYAHDQLFHPLGMHQTCFQDDHTLPMKQRVIAYAPDQEGHFHLSMPMFDTIGATGLLTTIEDLARWIAHLDALYAARSELLMRMLTPGRLTNGDAFPYGAGLFLGHDQGWQTVYHTGSDYGYRAQMLWFPQRQEAILLLCNLATLKPRLLVQHIKKMVLASAAENVRPEHEDIHTRAASVTHEADANGKPCVGLYYQRETEAVRRCFLEEGSLKLVYGPGTELLPRGEGTFRIAGTLIDLTFEQNPVTGQQQLIETDADGMTLIYELATEASPNSRWDEFEGTYSSEELGTSYQVVVRDKALYLLHEKFPPRLLSPTIPDGFWMEEDIRLRFLREHGQVNGFQASTHRVRRVHFSKQSEKAASP